MAAPIALRIPIPDPDVQAPFRGELAVTNEAIWIEQASSPVRLLRVDIASGTLTRTALPYEVALQASRDGTLWALGPFGSVPGPDTFTLSRVDPASGRLIGQMTLPTWQVVAGDGSVWDSEDATSAGVTTTAATLARTPTMQLVERDLSGKVVRRLDLELADLQMACGFLWGDSVDPERPLLTRVDPATGSATVYGGGGPVFDRSGECWRWHGDRLEELSPTRAFPAHEYQLTQPIFDGRKFWDGPDLFLEDVADNHGAIDLQLRDPATGTILGPRYTIDPADLPADKNGIEAWLLSAGGWLWLVNPNEVVRFDIVSR